MTIFKTSVDSRPPHANHVSFRISFVKCGFHCVHIIVLSVFSVGKPPSSHLACNERVCQ